ncbi:MAG: carbon-nitrogen hydrolase family protein [Candidatus Heimdallarchaeota archaeon]|nr:MAG: carbon-nitrogen hydrolase family protein [Candidatus Heimdallarchaeota archaeon]
MKLNIAAAQIQSHQADPPSNLETISKICQREDVAAAPNTIVVFPELAVTGYLMHDDAFSLAEEVPTGPLSQKIAKIAETNNCYLVVGIPEISVPGVLYNSAVFFGPEGFIGKGRKIFIPNHSVFNERRYFRSATTINVVESPFGKIGLQICYDLFSPEITRAHALLGAHTSICISASPGVRRQYFESFLPARAMENTINMVYVNQSGIQDDLIFWGGSEVRNATGKQVIKLKYDEPDFGIAQLDTDVRTARPFVPTLRDVPPWIYSELEKESQGL